MFFEDLIIPEK